MGFEEVKTFRLRCDRCRRLCDGKSFTATKYGDPLPPKGWKMVSVGPCGLTNYFRNEIHCPQCVEKEEHR